MEIKELQEKKQTLVSQLSEKLTELNEQKTPELKAEYEALEQEVEALDFQIAEAEQALLEEVPPIAEHEIKDKKTMDDKDFNEILRETLQATSPSTNVSILLPSTVEDKVVQKRDAGSVLRKYASVSNAVGNGVIPVEATNATAAFGTEIADITESNVGFDAVEMKANRCASLVKVSKVALDNAGFDLETELVSQIGRAMSNAENGKFINGTGTNEPKGLMKYISADNKVEYTTSITWADIEKTFYALPAEYRKNATWIMNSATASTVKALLKADEAQNKTLTAILERPVEIMEDMADNEMIFGDLSFYRIMDRKGLEIQKLSELYAVNNTVGFLGSAYVDGKLLLPSAVRFLTKKTSA